MLKFNMILQSTKKKKDPPSFYERTSLQKANVICIIIPMEFEKPSLDGLIDTEAFTSAISEQGLNKIKFLAPEASSHIGLAERFKQW